MKRIRFYIGLGKDYKGNPLEHVDKITSGVLKHMAELFGGYTTYQGKGGWTDPQGELVEEPSLTIEVYGADGIGTDFYLSDVAVFLRESYKQSCVMVTVEGVERSFV